MGSINSKTVICCAATKQNRLRTKRHPPIASRSSSFLDSPGPSQLPDQGVNSVVLTQKDFEGTNLKELHRSQPDIEHVQIGVCNGEQWILVDEDLEKLKALRHLTSVNLSGCHYITRRGLAYFSLNPGQIKTLILNDCPKITDKFFDHIVHFSHLERLAVRGCYRITDNGVEALTVLRWLRHLDISVCATDDITISETLNKRPTISDASMHTLARMNQLETLEVEGCLSVSDTGLVRLVTLRNLTSLNLSATGLTDWGLKILKHFPHLQTLQVAACDISERQALEQLTAARKLTHLDVSRVPGVTDRLIKGLAEHLDLTYLDISGSEHLSDNCMDDINTFSSLTHLNANACPGRVSCLVSWLC